MDPMYLGYGACVAAGGLVGFLKAGSAASLTAGLVFGGLSILGAYLVSINMPVGHWVVTGTAGVLTFVMGKRFMASGAIFPAGVITLLSILMFARCIRVAYYRRLVNKSTEHLTKPR